MLLFRLSYYGISISFVFIPNYFNGLSYNQYNNSFGSDGIFTVNCKNVVDIFVHNVLMNYSRKN